MKLLYNRAHAAIVIVVLLILPISATITAHAKPYYDVYRSVTVIVPAVEETPQGFRGVTSTLTVSVGWPGKGNIYISTSPLAGLDTQSSGRLAILVASLYAGVDYRSFDFFIKYNTSSTMISGPSASAATAIAVFAALKGYTIPKNFSMTGMIGPDGSINPVGGVAEKLEAVAAKGVKIFVIPLGERIVVDENTGRRVDLVELGKKLGVKVVEAATIIDVLRVLGIDYGIKKKASFTYPDWIKNKLEVFTSQLQKLAENNITIAENLHNNITYRDVKLIVERYLNASKRYLEESKRFQSQGMLYSAASRAFVSAWYATFASYLARAGASHSPVDTIARYVKTFSEEAQHITGEANRTYQEYSREKTIGIVSLQLAITLYDRIRLAREAVRQVNEATDPVDALAKSVYAYYRGLTALQWADMLKASLSIRQYSVPLPRLSSAVNDYIHYAEATLTYLRSLGVPVDMEGLNMARQLLTSDPIGAASLSVSTLSDGLVSLYAAFHTGIDRLEVSANTTAILAAILASKNITLLLPNFYREYAESIAVSGGQEAVMQAIGLYSSAASYMLLLYTLIPLNTTTQAPGSTTPATKTIVKTSITTVVVNNTVTVSKLFTTTIERTLESTTTVTTTVAAKTEANNWIYPVATLILVLLIFAAICGKPGGPRKE